MTKKLLINILICTWASAQGQIGFYGKYSVGYYNEGTTFIEDHLKNFWVLGGSGEPDYCEYLLKIDSTGKVKKRYYFRNGKSPYDLVEFNNRIYVSGQIGQSSYLAIFNMDGECILDTGYSAGIYSSGALEIKVNKRDSTLMGISSEYYNTQFHNIYLQKFDTLGRSIWYKYLSIPYFDVQASHLFWNEKTNTYTISIFNEKEEYRMVEIDTAANILSMKTTLSSKILYYGGMPRCMQLNNGKYMYTMSSVIINDTDWAPNFDVGIIYNQSGDSITTHIFGQPNTRNYIGIEINYGEQYKDGTFIFGTAYGITKLDSNFNLKWIRYFPSYLTNDVLDPTLKTIATQDGGCAIFGNTGTSSVRQDLFILKLNEFGTVGLNEINSKLENEITVYPNPANNEINISTPIKNATYTFTNMYGELVSKGKSPKINTSALANGIYFITLFDEQQNMVGTEKVLIQHD